MTRRYLQSWTGAFFGRGCPTTTTTTATAPRPVVAVFFQPRNVLHIIHLHYTFRCFFRRHPFLQVVHFIRVGSIGLFQGMYLRFHRCDGVPGLGVSFHCRPKRYFQPCGQGTLCFGTGWFGGCGRCFFCCCLVFFDERFSLMLQFLSALVGQNCASRGMLHFVPGNGGFQPGDFMCHVLHGCPIFVSGTLNNGQQGPCILFSFGSCHVLATHFLDDQRCPLLQQLVLVFFVYFVECNGGFRWCRWRCNLFEGFYFFVKSLVFMC